MMTAPALCLIVVLVPAGLMAVGYGLARPLSSFTPAERVAAAILLGLAALIWSVSVINLVAPLSRLAALLGVLPWLLPLVRRDTRGQFASDLRMLAADRRAWAAGAAMLVLLVALLWPQFRRADLVYYDGSASHDGFFWVIGAEYLTRASYLVTPPTDPTHPLFYPVGSIIGVQPAWGRMGAEGWLALLSGLTGLAPLKLYLAASAALLVPWVAAVFLAIKTFFLDRWPVWFALFVAAAQPLFVFFHSNANFPNLVGVIVGTGAIVWVARALAEPMRRKQWMLAIPLTVHAALCTYPEAFPVVILAIALLLVWRATRIPRATGAATAAVSIVVVAGCVVNPLSTIRAWYGFFCSLGVARAAIPHPDIFAGLPSLAKLNAMATLSVPVAHDFPLGIELGLSALLVVAAGLAIWRSRDRAGALIILSGVAVLGLYTLASGFGYGWQKTVQFSGVFVATVFAAAVLILARWQPQAPLVLRRTGAVLALGCAGLLAYATAANLRELYKWSERKAITRDWYAAQDFSRHSLANRDVLIDSHTFARPFFSTMWAAYFLADSRIFYPAGAESAGYLRADLQRHPPERDAKPSAVLVESESTTAAHAANKRTFGSLCFVLP